MADSFLGEGKFYALFSMLFGLGLTLQMERIEARGGKFVPLYLRRLLVLLGFGLVHAFLIWMGDILILYALLGFLLILFRKAKPRTLLVWMVILIALPLLFNAGATGWSNWGNPSRRRAANRCRLCRNHCQLRADLARAYRVYAMAISPKSPPSAFMTIPAWVSLPIL
jgi:uncharacterized membrane protein YeiB